MATGVVKWFNEKKGFGFIESPSYVWMIHSDGRGFWMREEPYISPVKVDRKSLGPSLIEMMEIDEKEITKTASVIASEQYNPNSFFSKLPVELNIEIAAKCARVFTSKKAMSITRQTFDKITFNKEASIGHSDITTVTPK